MIPYLLQLRSMDTHREIRHWPDIFGHGMSYVDARDLMLVVERTLGDHLHRAGCREYLLIEPLGSNR